MKKILKILLRIALVLSTIVYPGCMAMLTAAGWMYNVRQGSYPVQFRSWSIGMYICGGLLCLGTVLALLGGNKKLWKCNPAALVCGGIGCTGCLAVLYRFTAYADQNFSGIGETMQPVSELYRDRLLPVLLSAVLLTVLSVWQLLDTENRAYRAQLHRKQDEEKAPSILEE